MSSQADHVCSLKCNYDAKNYNPVCEPKTIDWQLSSNKLFINPNDAYFALTSSAPVMRSIFDVSRLSRTLSRALSRTLSVGLSSGGAVSAVASSVAGTISGSLSMAVADVIGVIGKSDKLSGGLVASDFGKTIVPAVGASVKGVSTKGAFALARSYSHHEPFVFPRIVSYSVDGRDYLCDLIDPWQMDETRMHFEFLHGKDSYLYECTQLSSSGAPHPLMAHLSLLSKVGTGLSVMSTAADLMAMGMKSDSWQDFGKGVAMRAATSGAIMYGTSYLLGSLPPDGYLIVGAILLLQGYGLISNGYNIMKHASGLYGYLFGAQTDETKDVAQEDTVIEAEDFDEAVISGDSVPICAADDFFDYNEKEDDESWYGTLFSSARYALGL